MRMNIKAQNCNSHYKTKNTGATFIIIQMRHKKISGTVIRDYSG